jgi:hypothetical protein
MTFTNFGPVQNAQDAMEHLRVVMEQKFER